MVERHKLYTDQRATCQRPLARHIGKNASEIPHLLETERTESAWSGICHCCAGTGCRRRCGASTGLRGTSSSTGQGDRQDIATAVPSSLRDDASTVSESQHIIYLLRDGPEGKRSSPGQDSWEGQEDVLRAHQSRGVGRRGHDGFEGGGWWRYLCGHCRGWQPDSCFSYLINTSQSFPPLLGRMMDCDAWKNSSGKLHCQNSEVLSYPALSKA